jgi:predicted PurR-regulated permease PerM
MERFVRFPVKTILTVLGLIVAVWALLHVIAIARSVIVYLFVALFLTLAINPLVTWLMRRGVRSRGIASALACLLVLVGMAAIGFAFVPTLVHNVNSFVDAVPGYVHDLTKGKGRLGFLETKYHVVERLERYVKHGGAKKLLGLSGAAISVTKGVLNLIVGAVTVAFLTFFMLVEGPAWMERFYGLLSLSRSRAGARSATRSTAKSAATSPETS